MKCAKCGQEYLESDEVLFCGQCGCKLDNGLENEKESATVLMTAENKDHEQPNTVNAQGNPGEKSNSIILQKINGVNIVLDPRSFDVINPKRAEKVYWGETFSTCGKFLLLVGIMGGSSCK